jgi:hypothetical protein
LLSAFCRTRTQKRNYQIGSLKKASNNHKEIIEELTEKLTSVEDFYQNEIVPTLKATIRVQAERIEEFLKQMPWAS